MPASVAPSVAIVALWSLEPSTLSPSQTSSQDRQSVGPVGVRPRLCLPAETLLREAAEWGIAPEPLAAVLLSLVEELVQAAEQFVAGCQAAMDRGRRPVGVRQRRGWVGITSSALGRWGHFRISSKPSPTEGEVLGSNMLMFRENFRACVIPFPDHLTENPCLS